MPICTQCVQSFKEIPPGSCDVCGLPGAFDPDLPRVIPLCADCQKGTFEFQLARSFGFYEGKLARCFAAKARPIEPLGKWFAARLAEVVRKEGERMVAIDAFQAATGKASAATQGKLGSRTWRFCHAQGPAVLTIYESCC